MTTNSLKQTNKPIHFVDAIMQQWIMKNEIFHMNKDNIPTLSMLFALENFESKSCWCQQDEKNDLPNKSAIQKICM